MRRLTIVTAFLLTLLSASVAVGDAPRTDPQTAQQINQANQKVRDGQYEQAIEDFTAVKSPVDRSVVSYNLAVAQFRAGKLDAAESLFAETAGAADASLAAKSRYNLGNCRYAKAIQESEKDKARAVELLRDAINHYRASLQGDPENVDARANIELAMRFIRQLQQEQNQDQQNQDQQNQDQQNQDQQNQDQQNQDQQNQDQQNQDQQNQKNSERQQSDSKDQQQDSEEQNESSKDSNPENEPNEDQQEQSSDQDDQQSQNNRSQRQEPQQSNQSPEEQNDEQQSNDEPQEVPTGDLKATQEQNDNPQGQGMTIGDSAKDDGLISKEEALKLLQAVRDRDMLRRLRQQQIERSRHQPVDRDW